MDDFSILQSTPLFHGLSAEALDGLDLQAYYDGLTTLRSDISAASQADNAPAETTAPTETAAPSETPAA